MMHWAKAIGLDPSIKGTEDVSQVDCLLCLHQIRLWGTEDEKKASERKYREEISK